LIDVRNRNASWRWGLLGWLIGLLVHVSSAWAGPAPQAPKAQSPKSVTPKAPASGDSATKEPATKEPATKEPATKEPATKDPFANEPGKDAAAPDAGAKPPANVRSSEIYGDRLDGLQIEVDQLKDKIFRSKARLALLKETVLRGVLAGSRIIMAHRNLMGSGFRMVRMVYSMDGAQIYARTDETGSLDSEDELVIYDGNLPPGPHNVTIELTYKGHGYGVFSYLTGMTFESRSSHSFTAPENGAVKLTSVGFERGNITTEMRDRPSVDWQEVPLDASGRPLPRKRRNSAAGTRK
jgi:hypothetical protein